MKKGFKKNNTTHYTLHTYTHTSSRPRLVPSLHSFHQQTHSVVPPLPFSSMYVYQCLCCILICHVICKIHTTKTFPSCFLPLVAFEKESLTQLFVSNFYIHYCNCYLFYIHETSLPRYHHSFQNLNLVFSFMTNSSS